MMQSGGVNEELKKKAGFLKRGTPLTWQSETAVLSAYRCPVHVYCTTYGVKPTASLSFVAPAFLTFTPMV